MLPERFEVLQRCSALSAEQRSCSVAVLSRSGMFAGQISRLGNRFPRLLASGTLRVPVAPVHLRIRVLRAF